jgi:hypothetical protein
MKFLIVLPFFLCVGCEVVSYDRTKDAVANEIVGQCFTTVQNAFLYAKCGSDMRKMGTFSMNACLPKNEEELAMKMQFPQCSSGFSLLTKLCDNNYITKQEAGTSFTVTKVVSTAMGETGRYWTIFASMDDGEGSVELPDKWFKPYWVTDEKISTNPEYLVPCAEHTLTGQPSTEASHIK